MVGKIFLIKIVKNFSIDQITLNYNIIQINLLGLNLIYSSYLK